MTDAQTWLNQNYPYEQRSGVRKLLINISSQQNEIITQAIAESVPANNIHFLTERLTGSLDLSDFTNLEAVYIQKQLITKLDLTNCSLLKGICASDNLIKEIGLPLAPNLKEIYLDNNNILRRDISCFANYLLLEDLYLGTNDENRISYYGMYNRWHGSLYSLRNLTNLKLLDIDATDINAGLEYLPTQRLSYFAFDNQGRSEAGVDQLKQVLDYYVNNELIEDDDSIGDDDSFDALNNTTIDNIRSYQAHLRRDAMIIQHSNH